MSWIPIFVCKREKLKNKTWIIWQPPQPFICLYLNLLISIFITLPEKTPLWLSTNYSLTWSCYLSPCKVFAFHQCGFFLSWAKSELSSKLLLSYLSDVGVSRKVLWAVLVHTGCIFSAGSLPDGFLGLQAIAWGFLPGDLRPPRETPNLWAKGPVLFGK